MELTLTEPGVHSSHLGRAQLAMARARHAAGRDTEARAAIGQALENLEATLGADHQDARRARKLLASLE